MGYHDCLLLLKGALGNVTSTGDMSFDTLPDSVNDEED